MVIYVINVLGLVYKMVGVWIGFKLVLEDYVYVYVNIVFKYFIFYECVI